MHLSNITTFCFGSSYTIALALEIVGLKFRFGWHRLVMLLFAMAGLVAHTIYLAMRVGAESSPLASASDWFLMAAWLVAAIYVVVALWFPKSAVGLFILPLVLALIGASLVASDTPISGGDAGRVWGLVHGWLLLLATLAVSAGFLAGLMYLIQSWRLKHKLPPSPRFRLPSLEWLEHVNSRSLALSAVLVAGGFLSGLALLRLKHRGETEYNLWTDPVVLSLAAMFLWLVAAEIFRWCYPPARRGRKVAYLTLASFVFLVVALASLTLMDRLHGGDRGQETGDRQEVHNYLWASPGRGTRNRVSERRDYSAFRNPHSAIRIPPMILRMVGCSHRQTGVAVRERLAFTPSQMEEALVRWRDRHPETEAVLLSTCNRIELYTASEQLDNRLSPQNLSAYLAESHALPVEEVRGQLVTLDDTEVVRHLFRVAASLDSMVLGEPQIMAQVKEAYDLASRLGSAGPLSHGCFQTALRVARRVAHETALHKHRVSIPSVAIADFASQIFERFDDKRVLIIGAGEMADETLRYLVDAGARQLVILNRDPQRAHHLATHWHGEAAPWSDLLPQLVKADLVISTTASGKPIVSLEEFRRQVEPRRQQRPLFILDLAMPRDFDPAISDELGTYLYSIDDLAIACAQNRTAREKEVPRAEAIIADEVERFIADTRHRASAAVIARLWEELERPKQAELERLFNKVPELDERQRQEILKFADRLVNKVMHPPMASLRDDASEGAHGLLEAFARLFQIRE